MRRPAASAVATEPVLAARRLPCDGRAATRGGRRRARAGASPAGGDDAPMATDPAAVLAATLRTVDGAPTTLRARLGPRATVVVFLRHFG